MTEHSQPSSFDISAATFQGLNLPGGKSYLIRVALWTALILTLIYAVLGAPIVSALVDVFQNAIKMEHNIDGTEPDPEVVFAMFAPMFRMMGLMTLIWLFQIAVFAAAETAIYRNVLNGKDRGVFPLTFGTDELRVFGTRVVVGLILYGVYLAIYIVGAIIGFIIFGLVSATGSNVIAALGGILTFVLVIVAIAVFVWVAIRLAPASAFAVKNKAFNPIASWTPMKGFVWPAIGCFVILYILGYFILMFMSGIIFSILFLMSGVLDILLEIGTSQDGLLDFSPVWAQLTSAGFIIPFIIVFVFTLFLTMIWYGMIWSMWGYCAKHEDREWLQTQKTDPTDLW